MPMMAHTTRSSISVNPRCDVRLLRLPIRILGPVQRDRLALGMYVEDVEAVGRERPGLVPAGAGPPVVRSGDRVAREAAQVLDLPLRHLPRVEPFVQPFQLFRVV